MGFRLSLKLGMRIIFLDCNYSCNKENHIHSLCNIMIEMKKKLLVHTNFKQSQYRENYTHTKRSNIQLKLFKEKYL